MRFILKANAYWSVRCPQRSLECPTMMSAEDSGHYFSKQPAAFAEATVCQGAVALQFESSAISCFDFGYA
jgi:hypothetical protein